MSISPEPSSSRTSRAFLSRAGCSRNWRFSSPQFLRNLITSSSVFTAFTISAVDSVPPPSLSMSSKHFRAAFKKSPVNSAISRCAARASSSRFAARSASLFLSAISMHSSLRGTSTGELRHQHAIAASKAPQRFRRRSAPLVDVDVPVAVRVHLRERLVEARRDQQVLQVFVAAVDQEINDFLVPASCACESLLRAVVSREHGIVAARKLKQRGRRANITLELPRQSQASRACPTRRRRSFEIPLARPASGAVGYASTSPRATARFSRRARRIRARRRVALRKGFGRRGRAFKNSRLNSSSAFSAARWRRSRSSASCARRFFRPRWMADSLCASGVMLLRRGDDASMASRRRHAPSTRPRESLYVITDAAKRAIPRCRFPPSRPRRAPPAPS